MSIPWNVKYGYIAAGILAVVLAVLFIKPKKYKPNTLFESQIQQLQKDKADAVAESAKHDKIAVEAGRRAEDAEAEATRLRASLNAVRNLQKPENPARPNTGASVPDGGVGTGGLVPGPVGVQPEHGGADELANLKQQVLLQDALIQAQDKQIAALKDQVGELTQSRDLERKARIDAETQLELNRKIQKDLEAHYRKESWKSGFKGMAVGAVVGLLIKR